MSLNAMKINLNKAAGINKLKLKNNNLIKNTYKNFSVNNNKTFQNDSFKYIDSIKNSNFSKLNTNKNYNFNFNKFQSCKILKESKRNFSSSSQNQSFSTNEKDNTEELEKENLHSSFSEDNFILKKDNKEKLLKGKKELFGKNDIDSILAEVNEFFSNNSNKNTNNQTQVSSEDILGDFNSNKNAFSVKSPSQNQTTISKQTYNDNLNENLIDNKNFEKSNLINSENIDASTITGWNNDSSNPSLLFQFNIPNDDLFEEESIKQLHEDSIFGYKNDMLKVPHETVSKFPFIKKLLYLYKKVFFFNIENQEFRFFCQNVFNSEELNLKDLDEFQAKQPLEIKMAYYIAFKSLRGSAPIFLNKNIKSEIIKKIESRNINLTDILAFCKLNIIMQDISLMYYICDFLNPIFTKSITEERYEELAEKNTQNIDFFTNLFITLLPCQKFLNLILDRYENLYMNIFSSIYNLRKYIFGREDISSLKGLLYILIKSSKHKKIKQSEIYRKFQILIDEMIVEYTDNYCAKIIDSKQFSTLANLFTGYYSTLDNLDESMIKKILDINYLCINLMEKFSEEGLLLLFKSIDSFLPFYQNVRDKIEDNEELSAILENIIYSYFNIYKPNTTISVSKLDFSKIRNLDLIYLLKLKYIFTTYYPRTNAEASSFIIVLSGLIDNSLKTITHYPIIYTIMGKCLEIASLKDRQKLFNFFSKNIKHLIDDKNFFLFVNNYHLLDKYGPIANVIKDYRPFIIRQLIKMFYFNQVYYIFAKPDNFFHTITALCSNTYMVENTNNEGKGFKNANGTKKSKDKTEQTYKRFEDSYLPTFPKEIYRFLNIIYYKIRSDSAIFNIYSNRLESIISLVKLTYFFEPQLLKENYFSVLYPTINFYGDNFLNVKTLQQDINFLSLITYYISLLLDNQELMLYQLKLLAKYVVIANKLAEKKEDLFMMLKKIEENYILNSQSYDMVEKNPKNPKFMKLILRIKNKVYMSIKNGD